MSVRIQRWAGCLLAFMILPVAAPVAEAFEATISARYRGETSGHFENTTPLAGFCRRWPADCQGLQAVQLPIAYEKTSTKEAPDLRDRYFVKLPARRTVHVAHERTGESHPMSFEMTAVSQQVDRVDNLIPASTRYVRGGCSYVRALGNSRVAVYLWRVRAPQAPMGCHAASSSTPVGGVAVSRASDMGVAYNLTMPAPDRMRPGTYRGSITYSIGPGGDFDFGSGVVGLLADTLTLNVVLEVEHAFIFQFPPGSELAVLEPAEGWRQWLGGSASPSRLYRDIPFQLWSTGPFVVYKTCQYQAGARCGIRNQQNDQVPVEVAISLPAGIHHRSRGVQRVPLPTGRAAALQFQSITPTFDRPGLLHFEVARDDVKAMLKHPGSTYQGHATVVFDAEI